LKAQALANAVGEERRDVASDWIALPLPLHKMWDVFPLITSVSIR
jgi:hypothetical protein